MKSLENSIKKFYSEVSPQKAALFTALFIGFKLSFAYDTNFLYSIVNEFLAIHSSLFWLNLIVANIRISKRNILPLFNSQILTIAILLVVELLLINFLPERLSLRFGIVQRFALLVVASLLFALTLYSLAVLVKFFFYRQKGDPKGYYRAMLVLILITGVFDAFRPFFAQTFELRSLFPSIFDWFDNFYSVVEIALVLIIALNSFRVAWIARLTKKEKIGLILRSSLLVTLYIVSLVTMLNNPTVKKIAFLYSPFVFTAATAILLYGAVNTGVILFTTVFHLPTAEESDKKNEELSMLWKFGKLLNQIFDFNELAESIISLAKQAGNTDRLWVDIRTGGNRVFLAEKIGEKEAIVITEAIEKSEKIRQPQVINLSESNRIGFLVKYGIEKILAVPLVVKDETKGFLFLVRSYEEESFDDDEINAVAGLADYASLAVSKAELLQASIEKERMAKELEVAREIQRKIIPDNLPENGNYEIAAEFMPAFEVGGDYYDFFELNGKTAFVIADVSGKGIEASYIMAETKGIFEALALSEETIERLIIKANSIFVKRLAKKHFVTAIVGVLEDEKIVYYRIGHNQPLIIAGNKVTKLSGKGLAFGLAEGEKFSENLEKTEIRLNPGEAAVFYTDGVNEAMNGRNEEFGYERFFEILRRNSKKTAAEIALSTLKEVSVFANKNIQNDDITLLIIKRK